MYANAVLALFLASSTTLAYPVHVQAPPSLGRRAASAAIQAQNAAAAQALNAKFATLTAGTACTSGSDGCIDGKFSQCVAGTFQVGSECSGGTTCLALPLVNSEGTSVACDTEADAIARIQAAGGSASLTGSGSTSSTSSGSTSSGSQTASPATNGTSSTSSTTGSTTDSTGSTTSSSSSSNFQLSNAEAAQALNAKFATLTADDACTNGEDACIGGRFAQCVGTSFQVGSTCAPGTTCLALPLVNSVGTSVTCDTEADAIARMEAAGASPSLTGSASSGSGAAASSGSASASTSGSSTTDSSSSGDCAGDSSASSVSSAPAAASTDGSTTTTSSSDFQLANAQQAQALNAKFATLSAGAACSTGEDACISGKFSQCVDGAFQVGSECSPGTTCLALPLVNKPGTSVTCDTEADAIARMQAAGASPSLTR